MSIGNISPKNGICTKRYPYMSHGKNGVGSCFKISGNNTIKAYPEILKEAKLNPLLKDIIKKILIAQDNENLDDLFLLRGLMTAKELVNIIVYDIQTTGVPEIIMDDNGKEKLSYPAIIQISLYHPKTGRHFTSYIKPHKPITPEVSLNTGIFNSFDLKFKLPFLPDECDPRSVEDMLFVEYENDALIKHSEVKDFKDDIKAQNDGIDEKSLNELAIDKFLDNKALDVRGVISLDELSSNGNAPLFYEITDDVFQAISEGTSKNTTTFLISHNGSRWGEPILRAELERVCASERLDETMIFLDSKDLFKSIIAKLPGASKELLEELNIVLGEERAETFNTKVDVIDLWKAIETVFTKIFETKDWNFIASKIAEEIYR